MSIALASLQLQYVVTGDFFFFKFVTLLSISASDSQLAFLTFDLSLSSFRK